MAIEKNVAIIGSGFGGLSLGVRLQSQGYDVTIYEKQDMVGGHAYQLKKGGYTFDLGPSLITAPEIIEDIFNTAGEDMDEYLDLVELDPYYRIYYHDGSYLDYNGNPTEMKKQLKSFNLEDAEAYDDFMEYARYLYETVITDGLGSRPFLSMKDFFKAFPKLLKAKSHRSAYSVVSSYFKDYRSRFAFSFHPLFIGGSPFTSPSLYLMIPYLERKGGVLFTKGGMYSVVEALKKVFEKHGGKIKTSCEVEKIVIENKKAEGIMVNGKFSKFDLVVSNAHFAHTYRDLIDSNERKKWTDKKIKSKDYSMSSFLIYLGVRKQYPELEHHTLILSSRYKELVDEIFGEEQLPDDFSMYLHAPTKSDPGMAPEGCESMYVLIPVPNLKADIDWEKEKDGYTKKILNYLEHDFGLDGLQENIEVQEIFTPKDFESKRNNYLGAAWSLQPTLLQSANFRPHNKSDEIENLYLVGASTHPGAGVPGVMLTAETTEKLIKNDFPLKSV